MCTTIREAESCLLSVTCLLFILLSAADGKAMHDASPDSAIQQKADSLTQKHSYLSFSTSYGNNSSFLGRYQSQVLPFLGADLTYMHKSGFWFSGMTYNILGSDYFIDEVDLMAGYSVDISTRWDASAYYGRYFFNENTELLKAYVANSASASLGFDWSILYSKLSATYIFGNGVNDVFLILDQSRYFEFPNVFGKNNYISIDPQVSLIAGTQTFYEQYLITEEIPRGNPDNPGKGNGKGNGQGKGQSGTVTQTTVIQTEKRSFNLMSYEFTLPVMYTRGKWSLETNGRYSVPVNVVEGYLVKPQFFFTSSLYYTIKGK